MLREIDLNIAHMHLCNTSRIIFVDNGGDINDVHTTRLLDVVNHPS